MKDIRIDVGVHTVISVNLADIDFTGIDKVILTVKNFASYKAEVIIEREFTTAEIHEVTIEPEESIKLKENAVYDFDKVLADGTRQKMTDNGRVVLRRGVGDCIDYH